MKKSNVRVLGIPAIVWNEKSDRVFIAVHGDQSHKEDAVIAVLADVAAKKNYQVISFDLAKHGARKDEGTPDTIDYCLKDLTKIIEYVQNNWTEINLFTCSIGTYYALQAYKDISIKKALFLSPIVDMGTIINNMMNLFNISEEQLRKEKIIETPINKTLYWDYYCYVKDNPIIEWNIKTSILYGEYDEIVDINVVKEFENKFACSLEIVDKTKHFFHTRTDLDNLKTWLNKKIN